MKETNFKKFQDFIQSIGLTHLNSDSELFILSIDSISESVAGELSFFRNEFYEITIGTNHNQFEFAIDGNFYPANTEPYVCFIAPNQLQSYKVLGRNKDPEGYIIYFSKLAFQNLARHHISIPFFKREYESYHQLTQEEYTHLSQWATSLLAESQNDSPFSQKIAINLLSILALKIKGVLKETKSAYSSRPEEIIDHFTSLIEGNSKHESVNFYAEQMALTSKQLNVLTKKVLNKTASKFLQEATAEKAKALILQSSLTLTEIAYELGFEELSNFSRLFKSITGSSPNQFREKAKKG